MLQLSLLGGKVVTNLQEKYPKNFFLSRIILYYHEPLLKKYPQVREYVKKALRDYENRYRVLDTSPFADLGLFPYQALDLAFSLRYKRTAWFWEQALGKTFTAVKFLERTPKPALVVAPKRVLQTTWLDYAPDLEEVEFVNYESLHKVVGKKTYRTIVFDESHYLKSTKAKRTRLARSLARKAEYVLMLTGTPVTKDPYDLYSQFAILEPLVFVNKEYFTKEFVILDRTGTFPVGFRNLEKLYKRIAAISSVRKKEDYLSHLPPKVFVPVNLTPSQAQLADWEQIEHSLEIDGVELANKLVQYQKFHQISSDVLYLPDGGVRVYRQSGKLEWLRKNLPAFLEKGEQVIVWYYFRAEGDLLAELLRELGIPFGRVECGGVEEVRKFQQRKLKVLLANMASLAEGVNLQNASIAVFHTLPWSYRMFAQAVDRIHRPGLEKEAKIYLLLYPQLLDADILQALEKKRDYNPEPIPT